MAYSPATTLLHFLRRLIVVRDADAVSDGELVKSFARSRDEAAFAELLRRHGPMVLGVCRRVLGDSADADDAYQATFLVLVRKANSLSAPESVANWLHGVAHRTALKARVEAAKRQQREREAATMTATSASDDVVWRDLRPVLDDEIQRLPARYRAPFVMCHLQGLTNAEAARQLGCPEGTVLSRLSRARERLRARLTKRGVTLTTASLAVLVTEKTASATVSAALSATLLKAGLSLAATGGTTGIVSTHVLELVEGVVQAMFVTKMKVVATLVLTAGFLAGAGAAGYSALTAEAVQDQKPEAEQPKNRRKGADDFEERRAAIELNRKLKPLMEKRLDAVREQMKARAEELIAGKTTLDVLLESSANLLKSQLEMSDKPVDQLKALETHFGRMKMSQEILETRFQAGKASEAEVCQAKYSRYDAEIALERYKAKLGPGGAKGEVTKALFEGTDWGELVKDQR